MAQQPTIISISDRKNFEDENHISSATIMKNQDGAPITSQTLENLVQGKKVAILIHGYNNEHDEAKESYQKITKTYGGLYDVFIWYYWPGGDDWTDYSSAVNRTTKGGVKTTGSGLSFESIMAALAGIIGPGPGTGVPAAIINRQIYDQLTKSNRLDLPQKLNSTIGFVSQHASSVDIFAHSMGNRLVLEAALRNPKFHVRNLFSWAPAIDNEALDEGQRYFSAASSFKKIEIFYSENDTVLAIAYRWMHFDTAMGGKGPENPQITATNVTATNSSSYIHGHSHYDNSYQIYLYISNFLKSGKEPPNSVKILNKNMFPSKKEVLPK